MARSTIRMLIGVVMLGGIPLLWVVYNLQWSPPPSVVDIQRMLLHTVVPGVANSQTGTAVAPLSAAPVRVIGSHPYPWGVVTSYANATGAGDGKLVRGSFGWRFETFSWGPLSALIQAATIQFSYEQHFVTIDQPYAELVYGLQQDPQATTIRVVFDDTTAIDTTISEGAFSLSTEQHGGACLLQVLDAQAMVLEEIRLTPRIPFDSPKDAYDCNR